MPNWCHNSMTITGSVDEIARFKQTCLRAYEDGWALDFDAIKPVPRIFYGDPGRTWFPEPDNREQIVDFTAAHARARSEKAQKAFEARALKVTGFAHASDWACKHWGTPGIAIFFHAWRDEPGRYECDFDTRWTPPLYIWEKLGEKFPTLDFSLSGYDSLQDFAFRGTIKDGKPEFELMDKPGIWETVDPKTDETLSGTLEEIGAVLGEDPSYAVAPAWDERR